MRKLRYKLHWASGVGPKPAFKWVIYDWQWICPVAYAETRVNGRRLCDFLNSLPLILLLAVPVSAQPVETQPKVGFDWPAFSAYVGGLTVDGVSTSRAMTNGSGCVEGNLAMSARPTNGELAHYIAPQIAVGALIGWMAQKAQNRPDSTPGQRRFVRWFARGFLWGRGAMGYEAAIHNVRLCGW